MTSLHDDLRAILNNSSICFLSADGIELTFETTILEVNETNVVIRNPIPFDDIQSFLARDSFTIQCLGHKIVTNEIFSNGTDIVVPINNTSTIMNVRGEDRFIMKNSEKLVLNILNPFDQETEIEKQVLEMSHAGISIRTRMESDLFSPGVVLSKMTLYRNGTPVKRCSGVVVYSRKYLSIKGKSYCQVGIKFND